MLDEETGAEPRAISASIADPYLLIIRDDSSAFIARIDSSNELEELDKDDQTLTTTKWLTGCLYADTTGAFAEEVGKGAKPAQSILMFLLSANGALHVGVPANDCNNEVDANGFRSIAFPTCRNRSMSLKGCHISLLVSRPIIPQGRGRQRKR
jgi:hypothetical protein